MDINFTCNIYWNNNKDKIVNNIHVDDKTSSNTCI